VFTGDELDGSQATSGTLYPPETSPEIPGAQWSPGSKWAPGTGLQDAALGEVSLSSGRTMLVVYAQAAGNIGPVNQQTRPYGMIFEQVE